MKLVYVAQAIDQALRGDSWSDCLSAELAKIPGVVVYRPAQAFALTDSGAPDPRLEEINRAALGRADALVAIVQKGVPSIGMPREIEYANLSGTPWAVLTDFEGSFSLTDAPAAFDLSAQGVQDVAAWVRRVAAQPAHAREDLLFAKVAGTGDGRLPTRAHDGDAGLDLYSSADVAIPAGQFADVPCGVRCALPEGVWGQIVGRSSTLRRRKLLVATGVIDNGYRGPLFAGIWNQGESTAYIGPGERLAQLILMPNVTGAFAPKWASADEFAAIPHDGRGEAGFGSSGA